MLPSYVIEMFALTDTQQVQNKQGTATTLLDECSQASLKDFVELMTLGVVT